MAHYPATPRLIIPGLIFSRSPNSGLDRELEARALPYLSISSERVQLYLRLAVYSRRIISVSAQQASFSKRVAHQNVHPVTTLATLPRFPSLLALGIAAKRLDMSNEAAIATLLRQCSAFFTLVSGELPADEVRHLLESHPAGLDLARKYVVGFERKGALIAIVDLLENYPEPTDWYVGLLVLSPDERNQGMGAAVWTAVEAWIRAEGGRHARLIVQEQNPHAARFWRARGFTADGTIEQHLPARTNRCMRFQKRLTVPAQRAGS